MGNKKISTIPIDSQKFIRIIHTQGFSIRKLGENPDIQRCDKTIRRWLDRKEMPADLITTIAAVIGINVNEVALDISNHSLNAFGWHPYPDNKPNQGGYYLVTYWFGVVDIAPYSIFYNREKKETYTGFFGFDSKNHPYSKDESIVAWGEIPAPYEKGE